MPGKRSRSGCWTCREKRRKCDEAKPVCANCRTRGISCGGYDIRLADFQNQGGYNGQMVCKITRGSPPRKPAPTSSKSASRAMASSSSLLKRNNPSDELEFVPEPAFHLAKLPFDTQLRQSASKRPLLDQPSKEITEAYVSPESAYPVPRGARSEANDEFEGNHSPRDADSVPSLPAIGTSTPIPSFGSRDLSFDLNLDFLLEDQYDCCTLPNMPPTEFVPISRLSAELTSERRILHRQVANSRLWAVPGSPNQFDASETDRSLDIGPGFITSDISGPTQGDTPVQNGGLDLGEELPDAFARWPERHAWDIEHVNIYPRGNPSDSYGFAQLKFPSPFDYYLYRHYFTVLAPSLYPLEQSRNPYKTIYGSGALYFKPLKDAILSTAALHLSCMGQLPLGVAVMYRQSLKHSTQNALQTRQSNTGAVATVMLSIMADVIGNGAGARFSELSKVRRLLLSKTSCSGDEGGGLSGIFLRLQFNWMVALGRTTHHYEKDSEPGQVEYLEQPLDSEMDFSKAQDYWFCNLPDYQMFHFFKAATLLSEKLSSPLPRASTSEVQRLILDASDLLTKIRGWDPEPSSAPEPYAKSAAEVNELWRQGLLCYIYQTICGVNPWEPRMQECIQEALRALRKLSWMQSVLWPLFMIGVQALVAEDRNLIANSLMNMNSTVKFTIPLSVLVLLRRVWDDMDQTGSGISRWRKIMAESGAHLNLVL